MKKPTTNHPNLLIKGRFARLALLTLIILMPFSIFAEFSIFYENGKKGIKDSNGKVTVTAKYDYLYPISNSENARFGGGGVYGMLDMRDGKILLPAKYRAVGDFYNNLAVVEIGGKCGFVDKAGNYVYKPQFDSASNFHAGTAEVTKGGRRYFIGVDGKEYDTRPNPSTLARKDYEAASANSQPASSTAVDKGSSKSTKDTAGNTGSTGSTGNKGGKTTSAATSGNRSSATTTATTPATTAKPKQNKPYNWRENTPTPYMTRQTRFIKKKVNYDNLPVVSEGIFYIQEYNRKIGYLSYYGFWTVDGRCLFPAIYEGFTKERPRFDSGACVVKATGTQRPTPTIIYADGTAKALSHEWGAMTQFYDGVAMVRETIDYRTNNLFYINTRGEKIWPHLAENATRGSIKLEMRPLREGLRAYYSNADKLWGFLDANGKVAIKPAFREVRDFYGEYALAMLPKDSYSGTPVFINHKGETVVNVPGNLSTLQYCAGVSDISDGYFAISDGYAPTTYYDLTGKEVKTFAGGATQFADGTAFVRNSKYGGDEPVKVINTNFDVIGHWPFKTTEFANNKPTFETSPYYTFDRHTVLNHLGEPVLWVPGGFSSDFRLGQFSPDGYASARVIFSNKAGDKQYDYCGYVDTSGRLTVVFSDSPGAGGSSGGDKPEPEEPIDTIRIGDRPPHLPPPIPGDTIPIGPVGPGEKGVRYRVNVTAFPAEGGKVYGSGEYAYGDTIRVTGTPAEGYELSLIECSRQSSVTKTFNKFVVKGDMDITCCFVKTDDVTDVSPGCFDGRLVMGDGLSFPVYMQLGDNEGNSYKKDTRGFLALIIDPKETFSKASANNNASSSLNTFFVPMNVVGAIEENGKRYMVLDGGVWMYSNLTVSDNSAVGMLNNPLLQMMLAFDGASSGELSPARYRVEIVEGSPKDGGFTLGMLQRHSGKYGWISAGDPSFHKSMGGFFVKRVDKGLPADFFNGIKMKTGQKRAVMWQPDESFFNSNQSRMTKVAASLGEMYREAVSGNKRLSEYDFRQFSTDLDNHVFKCKP